MATAPTSSAPLVLLAESAHAEHHHAEMLTRAGFRAVRLTVHEVTPALVRDVKPAIIAMEFDGSQPSGSSEYLQEGGNSDSETGSSDFAPQGQGATENEDDEDTGGSTGGGGSSF